LQLQLYVQELNELDSRRGRKPLDVSNLVYWFKNARAAFKRAEVRSQNDACNADWSVSGGGGGGGGSVGGSLGGSHPLGASGRCPTGDDSSDVDPRLDDDDANDIDDDDVSSLASERSHRSTTRIFDSHPLKTEPETNHEPPSPNRYSN